jgi:hypothetical protein
MRALSPNIYIYMRGEIYKEPLEKYINAKGYYTSNSFAHQAFTMDWY